jgi:hypothetical protein
MDGWMDGKKERKTERKMNALIYTWVWSKLMAYYLDDYSIISTLV